MRYTNGTLAHISPAAPPSRSVNCQRILESKSNAWRSSVNDDLRGRIGPGGLHSLQNCWETPAVAPVGSIPTRSRQKSREEGKGKRLYSSLFPPPSSRCCTDQSLAVRRSFAPLKRPNPFPDASRQSGHLTAR